MNLNSKKYPKFSDCNIAVLGLGYVGLPLALLFAETKESHIDNSKLLRKVIGFDINKKRINELKKGIDKTNEVSKSDLLNSKNLKFTYKDYELQETDVFIITVPTPIDKFKKPDLTALEIASKTVGMIIQLRKKSSIPFVIYESTVYPGATEEICVPILEKNSGLKLNKDFFVGYSPERVNPGDKKHKINLITKVTSGSDIDSANWIDLFYGSVIKAGTHKASSIKIAEAAKVIENTQRDLNIALVNELAFIFNKLNIPSSEVFKAACTKWNFLDFKPGLVGGHCIGIDPYYLTHKAKSIGYYPKVVLAGREINDKVSKWIVEQMVINMARKKIPIGGTEVLILGFSFKENCNDCRNTKVIDIVNNLKNYGMEVTIIDPLVDIEDSKKQYGIEIQKNIPYDKKFKSIIIAVAHEEFKSLVREKWDKIIHKQSVILDIKGVLPKGINSIRL